MKFVMMMATLAALPSTTMLLHHDGAPSVTTHVSTSGLVTINIKGCKVNEVVPVGKNSAHQDLGVECEDGSGYRIAVH